MLLGHETQVQALAFGAGGRTMATAGDHHSFRLWDLDTDRLARHICDTADPRLTGSDWDRYFPGLPRDLPCP